MDNSLRHWFFRILIIIAAALIIISFVIPWWKAAVIDLRIDPAMQMHLYGLEVLLEPDLWAYIDEYVPPFWLTLLAFVFIVVDIGAIILSMFIRKEKWGRLLLGGAGLAYLIFGGIALVYAYFKMDGLGLSFIGRSSASFIYHNPTMEGTLLIGPYIALAGGLLCIVLALLRNKITGGNKIQQ